MATAQSASAEKNTLMQAVPTAATAEKAGISAEDIDNVVITGNTVMLHLLRGSGSEGLSAMRYRRDNIIRPLLDVKKCEVLEFCKGFE